MKFILRILLSALLWLSVAGAETGSVVSAYEPNCDYPKLKTESAFLSRQFLAGAATDELVPAALCEDSFYQTDDGLIHMLLRSTGPGYRGRLWLTESRDDGATWSSPREALFPDNDAKFQFGRLPDGRFYYIGCPDSSRHGSRSPLALSLSRDGVTFDRHFIMGDEPYRKTVPGWAKDGEYGYPDALAHAGRLCVIVSRQKEAVQIICAALDQLGDGTKQLQTPCRKPAPPPNP